MAEFAYNNSVTTGNGTTPFYAANYGFHPRTMDPPDEKDEPVNPASTVYGHWMTAIHDSAQKGLKAAQEKIRRYTDPDRKPPPAYQVGDLVMLNRRNIKTRRPSRKMDHKNHGPFQIEKVVSTLAVRLTLPRKWKIHNVFHVSLLEPYRTSEHRAPPDPAKVLREADDIEQSEEYDVDEVMSSVERSRGTNKRILYLVKWLDYPERKDWTEEPFDNFSVGGLEKLREFHKRNPDAPRDYRLADTLDGMSIRGPNQGKSGSRDEGAGGLPLTHKPRKTRSSGIERRKTRFSGTEAPARQTVLGYVGLDWTEAVGTRYGTPLYVHLRGQEGHPGTNPE